MDAILEKVVQGSPLIVILLLVCIITLWKEFSKEREARINNLMTAIDLGNKTVTTLNDLTNAIRAGKGQ